MAELSLRLDDLVLQGLEVPSVFGPLGGTQAVAVHEFAGGLRTIQALGAFPGPIRWQGWLLGSNAWGRSFALDRKRVAGLQVEVQIGQWRWLGVITSYLGHLLSQWQVRYEIEIEPIKDLGGQASVAATPPAPEGILLGLRQNLNAYVLAPPSGVPVTSGLGGAITTLQQDIGQGLQNAGGLISNIMPSDLATISADVAGASVEAENMIGLASPGAQITGLDVQNYISAIGQIVGPSAGVGTQFQTVNPNLFAIAAQYLGDASQWSSIASLSGILDPQPTGQYTIKVPPSQVS